ncbi:MAG: DUF7948 domain-containing protein [Candidatus Thorarchaeota archaeon]
MRESTSFKITKPIIIICVLLIAGSLVVTSNSNVVSTNESEVLNESLLKENAQQAMQAQFYENLGQVQNSEVSFYGEMHGLGIGFTDSGVIYRLSSQTQDTTKMDMFDIQKSESITESIFVTLNFEGANVVTPQGHGTFTHTSNYFIGNDPDGWYTGVQGFSEIVYPNLYDNIDLIYRSSEEGLKYEFVVWPSGNPSDIKLQYEGIENLAIDDGSLVAETSFGPLIDKDLYIYQNTQSNQKEIAGKFTLIPDIDCNFGFQIDAEYNENLPLIIDPFLHYATFVGGSSDDYGYSLVIDSSNNAYVTGSTSSSTYPAFPTTSGANDTTHNGGTYDAFILKLSADGSTLLFATFIGGTGDEYGRSIALDGSNNVYATGETDSSNFPTTPGAYDTSHNGGTWDAFILKLSADGSTLLYSTYVGGSSFDVGYSIALDSSNNTYVTGYTFSTDFPTTPGAYDTSNDDFAIFILKLSADGSTLLYSTFVGGGSLDYGRSIALDSSNNAYVTGETASSDFPTTLGANDTTHNGVYDVFILKLSADGSTLLYSTFVGGSSSDYGYSIALDSSDNTYVTGYTESSNFPTTPGAYDTSYNESNDGFIVKLSADGSTLLYSTFTGGSGEDRGYSIALDSSNNAYVTGNTKSSNFPTTPGANDTSYNVEWDVFILKLSADGSTLLYSTYVGGSSYDYGRSIALDSSDLAYVTGYTMSSNFPTTPGAHDTIHNVNNDVFIMKVDIRDIVVNIETPSNTTYADDFITVSYTILNTPFHTTQIFFDGLSNITAFPSGSIWSGLSDGSHNLTIVATIDPDDVFRKTVFFVIETVSPDVDSPMDITYVVDSSGNYIHWTVGDWSPGEYKVEGNGSTIGLTAWSENGTISFNIDGLVVGLVYNHTITVYDVHGNSAIDTVFVKVLARADLSSPLDITIELGTTGHYLTWTIGSVWWPLPSYRIDGNGTTIDWTECTDKTISISIDGLDVGVWNFTISLLDEYDYMTTDTVFVTIVDTLAPDTTAPEIDSLLVVIYEEGETGNFLTWTPYELNPESYEIFRNGTSIDSGSWSGSVITIDVDGLSTGTYNYTIVVTDSSGNTASDTVTVIVTALTSTTTETSTTSTSATNTTTDTTPALGDSTIIILGSVGAGFGLGAVVVMLLFRKRQS